jgi:hypothetical protein
MSSSGYEYVGAELLQLGDTLSNYNEAIAKFAWMYGRDAKHILDFGAGIGTLSEKVRARGMHPVCLEPDAIQRAELQRRGFSVVSSLDEIADESQNFIYSSNVLEHIEDDAATLAVLRNKLQPKGALMLYLPAFQSLYSTMDAAVGHYRRYDRAMLQEKLSAAGLAVEQLYYVDFLGYFVTRLFRTLGNDPTKINRTTLGFYDRYVFPVSRAIETVLRTPVGKNVLAVARRPLM